MLLSELERGSTGGARESHLFAAIPGRQPPCSCGRGLMRDVASGGYRGRPRGRWTRYEPDAGGQPHVKLTERLRCLPHRQRGQPEPDPARPARGRASAAVTAFLAGVAITPVAAHVRAAPSRRARTPTGRSSSRSDDTDEYRRRPAPGDSRRTRDWAAEDDVEQVYQAFRGSSDLQGHGALGRTPLRRGELRRRLPPGRRARTSERHGERYITNRSRQRVRADEPRGLQRLA